MPRRIKGRDRLCTRFVAAWYERGKDLVAGIKLFGVDPKQDYKDTVAEVHLK
jgi:hypothetical protein